MINYYCQFFPWHRICDVILYIFIKYVLSTQTLKRKGATMEGIKKFEVALSVEKLLWIFTPAQVFFSTALNT